MGVEVRVLGPLEVLRDGRAISLPSAKPRLLLALLVARANHVVSVDTLMEGLWSGHPPITAPAVVQSYVSQLRKAIEAPGRGDVESRVLLRVDGGYLLAVAPEQFDAARFERLSGVGRAALADGRAADGLQSLTAGLALWRGQAFGELSLQAAIQPAAQRLAELHQLAIDDRTDAAMALGGHGELIGDLEAMLSEYPLRERLWGQLMVCLYRSGRQAEALGAYQRLRRHLADELGLEPCADLQDLEHEMLQQAPALDWVAPRPAPSVPNLKPLPHPRPEPSVPARPTGTVTFLLTDIEGSTRRWEADPGGMRAALAEHDRVLRRAIEKQNGWYFKHTGDGVCAAFSSPRAAIDTAVAAQQALELPVRMGVATGECETRDGDYFGPALNRAARIMGAGHGGMILLSGSTAALLQTSDLVDLGEHRLRDLAATERLFQVRADGLRWSFPPLRTLDAVPGNLAMQPTSFLGRERELKVVIELVQGHRLVTLTGVGGVGKTRLASHAAAELAPEFPDGVWLVELAPLSEPAAVPDAVASVLRLTPQAGPTITEQITQALAGRRMLLVLDNCEHVLDAAAALVEAILGLTTTVKVLATSREGLRLAAEQLCPVPPLDTEAGADSTAVELFVERARAVLPNFDLREPLDGEVVTDICRRLDGIALAIELAAARMVSLSAQDIRDRLGDRFRLLAAPRRGPPRHQTLQNVVQWSFDLLDTDEAAVLTRAAVFSDGFDLDAATQICCQPVPAGRYATTGIDEFSMLDLLESLVRKSLITVDRSASGIRYGMLETIRQFADAQLTASDTENIKRRHAEYFAGAATHFWETFDGPGFDTAVGWAGPNMANLRTGFRWALDRGEIVLAAALAAHTAQLMSAQQTEPIGWAEEALPAAIAADVPQLPRLLTAATLCAYVGRAQDALDYSARAMKLEADPRYDPYEFGMASIGHSNAHLFIGNLERSLEICADLSQRTGLARRLGLAALLYQLPGLGRGEEARALADEAVQAVREQDTPYWLAYALLGCARAFAETDPARAMRVLQEGVTYTQEHHLPIWEAMIVREAATMETVHGDRDRALALFDRAIASQHQYGNVAQLAATLASVAVCFDRLDQPDTAAVIYGSSTRYGSSNRAKGLRQACQHLTDTLGQANFEDHVAQGAAMGLAEAVHYARHHIQVARHQSPPSGAHTVKRAGSAIQPAE